MQLAVVRSVLRELSELEVEGALSSTE
eukprot:SAG31_NODE_16825_length_694_cov_1.025210_1_plen_26_part_10